jgi:asparagine synthase (glutamine-hydrolysing)
LDDPHTPVSGACEPADFANHQPPPGLSFVELMMYWDTLHYLPDDILTKVDRATMSVSLEARVPLLDHHIFEFAWRLPLAMKFQQGVTKRPMRTILEKYVPRRLTERPKRGFGVPLAEWLRGPLRTWMQDLLAPNRLKEQGMLDPQLYTTAMSEHLSGVRDRRAELWHAIVFQAWADSNEAGGARSRVDPFDTVSTPIRVASHETLKEQPIPASGQPLPLRSVP